MAIYRWHKIDLDEKNVLPPAGLKAVMQLLEGESVSDQHVQKIFLEAKTYNDGVNKQGEISADVFVTIYSSKAPTQELPTLLFFIQTTALVLKDSSYFGLLTVFNLDIAAASGSCLLPFSTIDTFYYKLSQPMTMCALSIVAVPVWNHLRHVQRLQPIWNKLQSPERVNWQAFQRQLLQLYLFCYQPITQACIQMLICRSMSEEGECMESDAACRSVLVMDYSVECSDDNEDYTRGRMTALSVLGVFVVIVPIFLLRMASTVSAHRHIDMTMRVKDMNNMFDKMDVDGSGTLDVTEIKELLHQMRMPVISIHKFQAQVKKIQARQARQAKETADKLSRTDADGVTSPQPPPGEDRDEADGPQRLKMDNFRPASAPSTPESKPDSTPDQPRQKVVAAALVPPKTPLYPPPMLGEPELASLEAEIAELLQPQPAAAAAAAAADKAWATAKIVTRSLTFHGQEDVVTKEEFNIWFIDKVKTVAQNPYDILFGTYSRKT